MDWRMRDPVDAAREACPLPAELDLVVGLGSVTDEAVDRVAVEVPEIGLMRPPEVSRPTSPVWSKKHSARH